MKVVRLATIALISAVLLGTAARVASSLAEVVEQAPRAVSGPLSDAERLYAEGSFALARERYRKASSTELSEVQRRWVEMRLADTLWRANVGVADPSQIDKARRRLESIADGGQPDRVRVEAQESLGDFWWTRRQARNWGAAWPRYQAALDWWAGARDVELARERYLDIVRRVADPAGADAGYTYGYYGNQLPLEILDNALSIATEANDRVRLHYLLAMTWRQQWGAGRASARTIEEFEEALAQGRGTDWYDDALFHYGEWLATRGPAVRERDAGWRQEPDYPAALRQFRRLLDEFARGETRFHDRAARYVEQITAPVVGLSVLNFFLPGSEIEYVLNWRNVGSVSLGLYRIDLTRDPRLAGTDASSGSWLQSVSLEGLELAADWNHDTGDDGRHRPARDVLRLEEPLALGAYLLHAAAGGEEARELVLVTDAAVVLKTSATRALAFACDAVDGSPLAGANVRLWQRTHDGRSWQWHQQDAVAGDDGLAVFDLRRAERSGYGTEVFVAAARGARQAFAGSSARSMRRAEDSWRIYAFTDRPAYRPGETARWKLVARRHDGSTYSTPAGEQLKVEVRDPRGTTVRETVVELTSFGSAWGELELPSEWTLGQYLVSFSSAGRTIGVAPLFRLEEYKLPEFRVSVSTPEEDGRRKTFRLGDTVEVSVEAEYYFGGPVAGADAEVVIRELPFYHRWHPPRDYPWLHEQDTSFRRGMGFPGGGRVVEQRTLATAADGTVTVSFDTPATGPRDLQYTIEARVTDASRREITASGFVRVTRQGHYAYASARHAIHRPQDRVEVEFRTLDANDQPVAVEGQVRVTRDRWHEIWIAPGGEKVAGEALELLKHRHDVFPPTVPPGSPPWHPEFRGYRREEILVRSLRTDAEGRAELAFTAEREGYYRIAWTSEESDGLPVEAETAVWVATSDSHDLGYRKAGVEIILDRDTLSVGRRAPVMLSVAVPDRWVLFTVEGEELESWRLVHVTGTAKLIELDVDQRHVPNVFLGAVMAADGELFQDSERVVVPPESNFLDVELKLERDFYEPGDPAALTVVTRDHEGRPVATEVALAVADASVLAIQQEYAGDPRRFFYGTTRPLLVTMGTTFGMRRYARLGPREAGTVEASRPDDVVADEVARERAEGDVVSEAADLAAPSQFGAKAARAPGAVMMQTVDAAAPRESGTPGSVVEVRSDFRSTALWQPAVVTGEDGRGRASFRFPDSLTTWKATARAATSASRFGASETTARTRLPLIVRLQAPRFFLAGDRVTLSAVINNDTGQALDVEPEIRATGLTLRGRTDGGGRSVRVPPHGEARVDWEADVERAGEARLRVEARGGGNADAMEKTFAVHEHGIEKLVARSGKLAGDELTVALELPGPRRPGATRLEVRLSPSLAATMIDALPYLVNYPYGCTEQTMSRFLPAAIVARTLEELGLDPAAVVRGAFGGIEPEHAAATHPDGSAGLAELDTVVERGLERLYDFQHGDGGWGWWKEGDSDPYMSAYVVWGLALAREARIDVRSGVLDRGARFLELELVEQETRLDLQAWMLHALAEYHAGARRAPGEPTRKAFDNLWNQRQRLSAYGRALLAISAQAMGDPERAAVLTRNLANGVVEDARPDVAAIRPGEPAPSSGVVGTAHWGAAGSYRRWYDSGVEATAFALRALLAIDPDNRLVEPATLWLVRNRRGAQWSNTRDSAFGVLALARYLRQSGELSSRAAVEVRVNGRVAGRVEPEAGNQGLRPLVLDIDPTWLRDGDNEIRLVRRSGDGPVYFAIEAEYFSLEEPIAPAGNELFVRRDYYRIAPRATLLKGVVYDRLPLGDGDVVRSGERVETVLLVEVKNDAEYLVFEDLKPAGLEAVEQHSGTNLQARELRGDAAVAVAPSPGGIEAGGQARTTGRTRGVYRELRDRKIALFVGELPQGLWEIRYELRAEVPGRFHALPVVGHAMYVPEIRGNGAEIRLSVVEAGDVISD